MSALKAYFLSRLMREKVLLLGFITLIVVVWFSSFTERARVFQRKFSETGAELQQQRMWLDSSPRIEAVSRQAVARLDPAKTFDSIKLHAELDELAKDAGISMRADDPRNEPSNYFNVHSLRIRISKVDYASLVKFYTELQKRSPYIGIEQISVQSEPNNPALLTAQLRVSSVEVLRQQG